MKAVDVLVKAKEIISDPSAWTKGVSLHHKEDNTFSYCAQGAMFAAVGGYTEEGYSRPWDDVPDEAAARAAWEESIRLMTACAKTGDHHFASVTSFNDNDMTTHADVMKAFDCAIAKAPQ